MLHICRYEKPDIVYLYMTNEYLELHEKDHRYEEALKKLEEQIDHKFEHIHITKRPKLVDVHIFDQFYNDFEKVLRQIYKEHGRDIELLINMSQGTSAMKLALQIIGAMASSRIRMLQVSDPEPGKNKKQRVDREFDLQAEWENDMDNVLQEEWNKASDEAKSMLKNPNRIIEVRNIAFFNRIQRENIVRLIDSYDYQAAFLIAENIRSGIQDKAFLLLKAAQYRICLKRKECMDILSKIKCEELMPYNKGRQGEIYEYMLWLSIKQMRHDYMDFIRGMTPLLYAVSKYYVEENLGIQIEKYCKQNNNGAKQIDCKELKKDENGKRICREMGITGGYDRINLSSEHLTRLIQARTEYNRKTKPFELLRDIEIKIRNQIAHQIYAINDEDIKNKTGYDTKEIMNMFKQIMEVIGFQLNDKSWNYYDQMNEQITNLLKL